MAKYANGPTQTAECYKGNEGNMWYVNFSLLFLAAATLSAAITPFISKIAVGNGVVDQPGGRKIHRIPVPRLGGISIALSFFSTIVIAYSWKNDGLVNLPPHLTGLCIGGMLILLIGLLDDMDVKGITAGKKLAGQIAGALALIPFGFLIDSVYVPSIGVVYFDFLTGASLTILWVVAITNAVNLIDGLDGYALGVAAIASLILGILCIMAGKLWMSVVLIALFGSALGVLYYNWSPARIFIGDSGALFMGFILAAVSIEIFFRRVGTSPVSDHLSTPITVLGLPILDMIATVIRRFWSRKSLFTADKKHLHHRLLDAGLSTKEAVLTLYTICAGFGILGLVTARVGSFEATWIPIGAVLAFYIGLLKLEKICERTLQHNNRLAVPETETKKAASSWSGRYY